MPTLSGEGYLKPQWEVAIVFTTPGCPTAFRPMATLASQP